MKFIAQHIKVILIIITVIVIIISVYGYRNKKQIQEEVDELYRMIRKGVGAQGNDVKAILDKIAPDTRNPKFLKESVNAIYGSFLWKDVFGFEHRNVDDDEEKVKATLKKMSKGQLKAMLPVFASDIGIELDDFLRKHNNEEELKSYYTIVSNLR